MNTVFFVDDDVIIVNKTGLDAYQEIYEVLKKKYPKHAEACEQEAKKLQDSGMYEFMPNEDSTTFSFSPVHGLKWLVEFGMYKVHAVGNITRVKIYEQ